MCSEDPVQCVRVTGRKRNERKHFEATQKSSLLLLIASERLKPNA